MSHAFGRNRAPIFARPFPVCLTVGLLVAGVTGASAHATFENETATQDTTEKLVLRVPHGCAGQATQTVRISIPDGVIAVKPMPKAGWKLATSSGQLARTYVLYGKDVSQGVKEIVWSGGMLPDDQYDEFVFQARITTALPAGESVFFPVVQECATANVAWTEIPERGQDPHALKSPAPGIAIKAAAKMAAGHDHGAMAMNSSSTPAEPRRGPVFKAGAITLSAPWTRATPGGATVGGGYMRITNTGALPDRLVSATAEIARQVEIHEMSMDGGVMRMRALPKGLEIKPGETVELRPGGFHVMFINLTEPLVAGGTVKGYVEFEKGGRTEIEYRIEPLGTSSGDHDSHAGHGSKAP